MRLLELLNRHRGALVHRQDILHHLWGETGGSDELVTSYVATLRKTLGAKNAKLIRTVPKRGYILDLETISWQSKLWLVGKYALISVAVLGPALSIFRIAQKSSVSIAAIRPLIGSDAIETNPAFDSHGSIMLSSRPGSVGPSETRIYRDGSLERWGPKLHPGTVPGISPAGDRIVFDLSSGDRCAIELLHVGSGTTRSLTECTNRSPRQFDWSPDGAWVAMAGVEEYAGIHSQLFLIEPENGEVQQLFTQSGELRFPRFAPDSTRIAFTREIGSAQELVLGDIQSGSHEPVGDWLPTPLFGYDWIDGHQLLVSALNPSLEIELAVADLRQRSVHWTGVYGIQPAVSDDHLAFVRQSRKRVVHEIVPDELPEVRPVHMHPRDRFIRARPGGGFAIASQRRGWSTVDLIDQGGRRREIYQTSDRISGPAWSPGGNSLAFMAGPSTLVQWDASTGESQSTTLPNLVVNDLLYVERGQLVLVSERESESDLLLYDTALRSFRMLEPNARSPRVGDNYLFFLKPGEPGIYRWEWRREVMARFVPESYALHHSNWGIWRDDLIAPCAMYRALCAFRRTESYRSGRPILPTIPAALDISGGRILTIDLMVESQVMHARLE